MIKLPELMGGDDPRCLAFGYFLVRFFATKPNFIYKHGFLGESVWFLTGTAAEIPLIFPNCGPAMAFSTLGERYFHSYRRGGAVTWKREDADEVMLQR